MRWYGAVVAVLLASAATLAPARSQDTAGCQKSEFEAVVDQAAASLRDLNAKNKPAFQTKLRALKDKRGWSQDQFMEAAAPFVRDDQIAVYDKQSEDLLGTISSMGQQGSAAKTPDCGLLTQLQAHMKVLVETQTAKWTYMSAKIDGELAK